METPHQERPAGFVGIRERLSSAVHAYGGIHDRRPAACAWRPPRGTA